VNLAEATLGQEETRAVTFDNFHVLAGQILCP
jgi:hypothetical protein